MSPLKPELSRCRAIIFDMDGVITDTEPLHAAAEQRTCRDFGMDVPCAEWENFRGRTAIDIFNYLADNFGGTPRPSPQAMIDHKTGIYLQLAAAGLPTVPGALDFIRLARRRFSKVALATSSNQPVQRAVFDRYGLDGFFDAVTTGDDLTRGKPDPEAYLRAANKIGVSPDECLVIEDSDNGIRAALAAGCRVIGIATSYPPATLATFAPHHVVKDYAELTRLIESE